MQSESSELQVEELASPSNKDVSKDRTNGYDCPLLCAVVNYE
jgi:hypothetical protein